MLSNRGLGINATMCLYEVIIPTVLYGAEVWELRSVEGKNVVFLRRSVREVLWEGHEWIELGMKWCIE